MSSVTREFCLTRQARLCINKIVRNNVTLARFTLDEVKPGLNDMIFHLGYDDPEREAITAGCNHHDAQWRQRDFDVVRTAEFKEALRHNQIVVVTWRDLSRSFR